MKNLTKKNHTSVKLNDSLWYKQKQMDSNVYFILIVLFIRLINLSGEQWIVTKEIKNECGDSMALFY